MTTSPGDVVRREGTAPTSEAVSPVGRLRSEVHALVAITGYYADALILKSPSSVVAFAVRPLSFLFLVAVISNGALLSTAIVGALISFVTGVGIADLPIELSGMKRRSQFYELFRSLPISRITMALAITVGQSLPGLLYGILLVAVLIVMEGLALTTAGVVVLVAATLWVWGALAGYALGAWFEKPIVVRRAANVVLVVSTTLAPVYYPLELLPDAVQSLALVLPPVSAAYLIRFTFGSLPMRPLAVASLAGGVVVFGILALRVGR